MLIIGDSRLPAKAIEKLSAYGTFVPFSTCNITYDAVSGHPDLFFCQQQQQVVVAPNMPEQYLIMLQNHGVSFTKGKLPVGKLYPQTSRYNAVVSSNFLIHNAKHTDPSLKKTFGKKEFIHVNQGYTRCNLLVLNDDLFITSDNGIFRQLKKQRIWTFIIFRPMIFCFPALNTGFSADASAFLETCFSLPVAFPVSRKGRN